MVPIYFLRERSKPGTIGPIVIHAGSLSGLFVGVQINGGGGGGGLVLPHITSPFGHVGLAVEFAAHTYAIFCMLVA